MKSTNVEEKMINWISYISKDSALPKLAVRKKRH